MKKNLKIRIVGLFLMACFTMTFLPSCGDDKETTIEVADKTEINALLVECDALLTAATSTNYPEASIEAFKTKVTAIKTAVAAVGVSQSVINNLLVQLTEAKATFEQSAYGAIPADKLVAEWSFDEGKGTELTSTGTEKWVALLQKGPSEVFGTDTELPTFVSRGSGKAINLTKGSFLAVNEFATAPLLGNELSISVWVSPKETKGGNYIVSFNYWMNWKLNLETFNKPFFTVKTTVGGVDADNETEQSAPNNQWSHIVVSMNLSKQTLAFYVNGELTKTWDATSKPNLAGTQVAAFMPTSGKKLPLLIGAESTYAEVTSWEWTATPVLPVNWNSFNGSLDELKIYNVALTEGQVSKLYNDEK